MLLARSTALLLSSFTSVAAGTMPGVSPAQLFPEGRFDERVPTPADVVGIDFGARPLRHAELLTYLRALDEASARARLTAYARSHEGRELVYLAISDESTMAALDAFREEHARRVDPRGRPASEDAGLVAQAKAVAWMAYAIHGDELSSADAAAALAYRLVAGEDEDARRLRRELVVLVDPCENPDGRERFLAQTTSFAHRLPSNDTEDLSHTTVWPWGRGNHYLFDLNRDWFSMVQPESRRSAVIATWNPQLVVDSHEMGADDTYLFPPPRHPFNPYLPRKHRSWIERFSADQARALDRRGYPYYTREWNEEFFPGYGSSWASYLGAIGILYEMSSTEGTLVRKRDGSTRTYAQAVEHHVVSSVANLTTLAGNRRDVLADFVAHRRETTERNVGEGPAAWILPRGRHPERTDALVRLLGEQGVEVRGNRGGRVRPSGLRDARTGEAVSADTLPRDLYLVSLQQPAGALARQILDPHIPMEAGFLREEREYLERGKGSRLYEITAWSLPLAYDIEAWWTRERAGDGWSPVEIPEARGALVPCDAPVAYLIDGVPDGSTSALADLLQRGIPVRVAEKPFRLAERDYPRSTLLVRREGAPTDVERQLGEVASTWGVDVRAVGTARAGDGPDLGGSHFQTLVAPRVGVFTGWPVSPGDYGAVWHLLDEVLHLRFNALDIGRFSSTDLGRYNVLVLPPLLDLDYASLIEPSGVEALGRWIESGGTAIGIGNGAEFLADAERGWTSARPRRQALERFPPAVIGPAAKEIEGAGPMEAAGLRVPPPPPASAKDSPPAPKRVVSETRRTDPYDIAPVLGPGARPFASGFPQGTAGNLEPHDLAKWLETSLVPGRTKPEKEDLERADRRLRQLGPRGAFLLVELDRDHWLGWGLPESLPVLALGRDTLVAEAPAEVAARYAAPERLHLGGLLWPEAAGRLAHTAYLAREAKGRGQVILFPSSPEFRGWTLGSRRLLVNALLYGPGLGTRWSTPW